jgi:hypothetical protein
MNVPAKSNKYGLSRVKRATNELLAELSPPRSSVSKSALPAPSAERWNGSLMWLASPAFAFTTVRSGIVRETEANRESRSR